MNLFARKRAGAEGRKVRAEADVWIGLAGVAHERLLSKTGQRTGIGGKIRPAEALDELLVHVAPDAQRVDERAVKVEDDRIFAV